MANAFVNAALELVREPGPAALGPDARPGTLDVNTLNRRLDELFAAHGRPAKAELIRSLLLLWHDHLDASHDISQSEYNPDGSLVHAIMHRREPDYSNAKYWWRSTGDHPAFPAIAEAVEPLLAADADLQEELVAGGNWDAFAFTDAVAGGIREAADSPRHRLLREIQQTETEVMLAHLAG